MALLKAIASTNPPNWQFPIKFYSKFKWERIGATIYATDQDGVSAVLWAGHVYIRRSGENKRYGAAIWFSRGAGKDDDGETNYVRLCTFRNGGEVSAEPLPDYVKRELTKQ
ncbi:MAG TPA: single-stranded DNA-binding protein [Chroococcidiopsis sp.]